MITEIALTNFRGHTRKLTFGRGLNRLRGPNEAGKSTVKEAIAFAFLGTTAAGAKNPDWLITVGQQSMSVALTTPKSLLERKKREGATSDLRVTRPGIPAVKINQTDMQNQLRMSPELFMSTWCVGYFMNVLRPEERLRTLAEIAKIDRAKLIEELLGRKPPEFLKLDKIQVAVRAVADQRRQRQNKVDGLRDMIATENSKLSAVASAQPDTDVEKMQAQVNDLAARVAIHEQYNADVRSYQTRVAVSEERLKELKTLQGNIHVAEGVIAKQADLNQKKQGLADLSKKLQGARAEKEKILGTLLPAPTFTGKKPDPSLAGQACPTCSQTVEPEFVGALTEIYNKEVQEFNKVQRGIEDRNAEIRRTAEAAQATIEKLTNETQALSAQITRLEAEIEMAQKQKNSHALRLRALESELASPLVPPVEPPGSYPKMKEELENLRSQVHSARLAAGIRGASAGAIAQYKEMEQKLLIEIEELHHLETTLESLPEIEARKTLEAVTIEGVQMSLSEGSLVIKDMAGVDYNSLSDGRRMKIDLLLCVAIKKAAGPTSPPWIFIDNADLIDKLPEFVHEGRYQIFVAEVDPDAKELTVVTDG